MFYFLRLVVSAAIIIGLGMFGFWYFKTPQPISFKDQIQYVQNVGVYKYFNYKRPKSMDETSYWLPLADKGNTVAQFRVSELYFQLGERNADYYKAAMPYLKKSAEAGLPQAQNALGVALHSGIGIEQDKLESYKWFSLAARQNFKLAEKNLEDLKTELTLKEQDAGNDRINIWLQLKGL